MGFWGSFVIAQPATALADHPLISSLGGDVDLSTGAPGTWQAVSIHAADLDASSLVLQDLVDATAAAAMVAIVADSDFARVTALSPDGSGWETVINPEGAAAYGVMVDSVTLADAPGEAVAWADAAGAYGADVVTVAQVLNAQHTFAEEGVMELAQALGIWSSTTV